VQVRVVRRVGDGAFDRLDGPARLPALQADDANNDDPRVRSSLR
jgi:hypothetical protein